jgi:pimeloyl-ACP methyl ester carboxylesterase
MADPRFAPLFLALAALSLAGCTSEVREADLLRPVTGGMLAADALAKAAPAYTMSEERIRTPDGATLYGVHLRQPRATATVLYFGGNGYTIERYGPWSASVFAPLRVDLMIVDHRGYGPSEGRPTVALMGRDGEAAFDHLARKLGLGGRIVLHGHSLGSFIAGHVAANRPAAGVVLESSATTAEEWTKAAMPGIAKPFLKVKIDPALQGRGNLSSMASIEEPLLIIVGAKDRTTPPSLSQALYAASPLPAGRKRIAVIAGAGHTDAITKPQAAAAYRTFLSALP